MTTPRQITASVDGLIATLPSEISRSSYAAVWGRYRAWLKTKRIDVTAVRPRQVEAYMAFMQAAGKTRSTCGHALSIIRSMYGALVRDEVMDINPAREVKTPHGDQTLRTPCPPEADVSKLLRLPAKTWEERRDFIVLGFCFGLGWRRAEVARIRVEDLAPGTIRVGDKRVKGLTITGWVKRHKLLTVGMPPWLSDAVLVWRRRAGITAGALLPRTAEDANQPHRHDHNGPCDHEGCNPAALTGDMVYAIVKRAAARAGLPRGSVTPHALRRANITIGGERGVDLKKRQLAVGHASSATTERYDKAREAAENAPGEAFADMARRK